MLMRALPLEFLVDGRLSKLEDAAVPAGELLDLLDRLWCGAVTAPGHQRLRASRTERLAAVSHS